MTYRQTTAYIVMSTEHDAKMEIWVRSKRTDAEELLASVKAQYPDRWVEIHELTQCLPIEGVPA